MEGKGHTFSLRDSIGKCLLSTAPMHIPIHMQRYWRGMVP
jgi:hypothetical protein